MIQYVNGYIMTEQEILRLLPAEEIRLEDAKTELTKKVFYNAAGRDASMSENVKLLLSEP